MTILITGSSSYIGKNLIKKLEEKKIKFIGVDLKVPKKANYFAIDILNNKKLDKLSKTINLIIHLAAVSNENDANKDPTKCFDVNFLGTMNLLNFAKKNKIPKIIFASTEWVYDNSIVKVNSINQKLNFYSIKNYYASSKYLAEQVIRNQSFIKYCILRFGIIYGKREKNLSAVEAITKSLIKKDKITIGSKKTMRRFIHIDDIVSSIIKSIEFKNNCLADIQGPEKVTLEKIILLISKILKKSIKINENNQKNPSIRNVSLSKKIDKIKWKPNIKIEKGLLDIIE